jgi:hypothetical protein
VKALSTKQALFKKSRSLAALGMTPSFSRGLDEAHIFICPAVIKEPAILLWNHTLHKDDVGDLADHFPFFFWGENRRIGTIEDLSGIVRIEDSDARAVYKMVVGAVVDEDDALWREYWRRAGFDDARIKLARAARENGSFGGFSRGRQQIEPSGISNFGLSQL